VAADAARRRGDVSLCRKLLEEASGWILHSGSVEHLCLLHLVNSRAARAEGHVESARRAVEEGLHLARRCGLKLFHVELLCEAAEVSLARSDSVAAEPMAHEALRIATAADCQFMWGAAESAHLIGQASIAQGRPTDARSFLEQALDLRRRLRDPRVVETERLLRLV